MVCTKVPVICGVGGKMIKYGGGDDSADWGADTGEVGDAITRVSC